MIFEESGNGPPIGTGFGLKRSGLVLTADHVVGDMSKVLVVNTYGSDLQMVLSSRIIPHHTADVAAIMLPTDIWHDAEYFELGTPPPGYFDFPLGEEVLSYGYPQMGIEKPIPPRLMKGYIQRQTEYKRQFGNRNQPYCYSCHELSFPAFHGQSGSPVVLDNLTPGARNKVIGIVTDYISFTSEHKEDLLGVSWSIAASLIPLADWVEEL